MTRSERDDACSIHAGASMTFTITEAFVGRAALVVLGVIVVCWLIGKFFDFTGLGGN